MVEAQELTGEQVAEGAGAVEVTADPGAVETAAAVESTAAVESPVMADAPAPAAAGGTAAVEAPAVADAPAAAGGTAVVEAPAADGGTVAVQERSDGPAAVVAPAAGDGAVAVQERPERPERVERPERGDGAERPPRAERPERGERPPRGPRGDRGPQGGGREAINMKALLEAGVHFGHQTRRWNPTMKRYIFTQRNGIHIIDLQQTLGMINDAYKDMVELVANGGKVMFIGTKRQAQEVIQSEADRCGMWYVNQRWLGGTLTNFQTIRTRISYMLELQQKREQGYFRRLPKKEGVKMRDTLNRLEKYFTGMRDMNTLPQAIFVIDIGRENICVAEARRLGIKVFAIVDSDCNPDLVNHIIPGNDDAVRSIRLVTNRMASAVLEGLAQREAALQAEMEERNRPAEEPETLSEREDAALSGAVTTLDADTLAELAAGMSAGAAGDGAAGDAVGAGTAGE